MAIFTAIGATLGSLFAGASFKTFVIETLANLAVSAVVRKLTERDNTQVFGTNGKLQGGDDTPRQFPLGLGPTEGSLVYASYWGNSGAANSHITQVIALSDLPVKGLLEVWIDGVKCTLGTTALAGEEDLGLPVVEYARSGVNYAWVKFYDGTQTTADPLLRGRGAHPDYPWSATAIGRGVAYAVVTSRVNDELFSGFPRFKFVLDSVRLYDPSKDTSVGGVGTQRWNNPATWGGDGDYLPVVQAYNILRGIRYNGQWLYGFQRLLVGQIPVAAWISEINKCRASVTNSAGQSEPRFRAGGVFSVGAECGDALEAIMAAAAGRVMEIGGIYKPQVGVRGVAVATLTDDQITTSEGQQHSPFKRLAETINAVVAKYPEPAEGYALKDAPAVYNPDLEAKDQGRRLPNSITLANVPYVDQVQRIIAMALEEARRERRHALVLPPSYYLLEPGDEIIWSSARHGYVDKPFRVAACDLREDCHVIVDLIEIDDSGVNYDAWTGYRPVVTTPVFPADPAPASLFGFNAVDGAIVDASSAQRRPTIECSWSSPGEGVYRGFEIQIALASAPSAITKFTALGEHTSMQIASGILPATNYLVRGAPITKNKRQFSAWLPVTTRNLLILDADLDNSAAPPVPTGLALTSALSGSKVTLAATWTAVAGSRIRYEVRIRQGAGADVVFMTTTTRYEWDVLPNTAYTVAVRAVNRLGVQSAYSSEVTHTSTRDTTPPALPTGLTVTSGFETLWLKWVRNTETDLAGYEVFESTTATPAPVAGTVATYATAADTLVITALPDAVTRHYWLRAVDTSGNKSAWTARVQGTTLALADADISGILQSASYAAGLVPPLVVSSLPTSGNFAGRLVVLTTDGKLYRHTGSPAGAAGYTTAVPATDVTGQLTNAQIADLAAAKLTGTITAPQIADGAVTDAKIAGIAASKVTGQLTNAQIADLAAAKLTGTITAPQIADGAVTDAKIAGMAASKVTGQLTDAQIAAVAAAKLTGQLTNAQIADLAAAKLTGQVTNTQISDNAISTPKLSAGAVVADKIAAGAVTTEKLTVLARDLVNNPTRTNSLIGWGGVTETGAGGNVAQTYDATEDALALTAAGNIASRSNTFLFDHDKIYRVSFKVRKDQAIGLIYVGVSGFTTATAGSVATTSGAGTELFSRYGADRAFISDTNNPFILDSWPASTTYIECVAYIIGANRSIEDCPNHSGVPNRPYIKASSSVSHVAIRLLNWSNSTVTATLFAKDVSVSEVGAGQIVADNITSNAITTAKIAANAVTAAKIEANAVTAAKIEAGAVTTAKLAAGAVTANEIAAGAVTAGKIAASAVTATEIAAGAVTAVKIDAGAVTTAKLAANAVTANEIAANAVTAAKIEANAVTTAKLAANAVTANEIAADAIVAGKVAANAIDATAIAAGAITAVKIDADAVTTAKIAASAVLADKIAANAVTAAKIEASAVTTDKLAANAVTAAKIAANTITAAEISAGAIGADQIAAGAIVTSKLGVGDFTNLVPDPNFNEFGSTWTTGAGTGSIIDAPTTDWAYPRVLRVVSPTASLRTFLGQPFDVRAGDPLWFWVQAQMVSGTGAITGTVQFSETANFAVVLASSTVISISSTAVTAQSIKIAAVPALARYARIRFAFPTTGSEGLIGRAVVRRAMNGEVIIDGSITADSVGTNEIIASAANIKDAVITDAKIANLSAAKLTAGSALAGSITVSGTALSTIQGQAANPAAVVNAGATKIDPGQVTVSGATTLADWRRGGDETKIDGGALSANTVSANKLTIGNRMVTLTAAKFEHNSPTTNRISWTAGNVRWSNDAGGVTNTAIAASSANVNGSTVSADIIAATTWTSGNLFVYWTKGEGFLRTTTTQATAFGADNIVLAVYAGGTNMTTDYGQTIIDGSNIKTGTITADQLTVASAVITDTAQISNGIITTAKIGNAQITSAKIGDAQITTAKIGDAQVNTLQIAGEAVTIPVNSYTAGDVTTGTSEVTVASVTIARASGFVTRIGMSVLLRPSSFGGGNTMQTLRLYRGTTEILNFTAIGFDLASGLGSPLTYTFSDSDTSGGTVTYELKAIRVGSSAQGIFSKRFMEAQQFKR